MIRLPLILKASEPLYPPHFLRRYHRAEIDPDIIECKASFKDFRIGVAICLEPVLEEISTLSPCTNQKKLLVLPQPLNREFSFFQIHPSCSGNTFFRQHVNDLVTRSMGFLVFNGAHRLEFPLDLVLKNYRDLYKR